MKQLEREVIGYMRAAITHFDTDSAAVRENYYKAHDLFSDYLMQWSESFSTLYNEMRKIYRAHTPKPTGHYRNRHLAVGYSSFSFQTWVKDKEQPAIPTADELVVRFDLLIREHSSAEKEYIDATPF